MGVYKGRVQGGYHYVKGRMLGVYRVCMYMYMYKESVQDGCLRGVCAKGIDVCIKCVCVCTRKGCRRKCRVCPYKGGSVQGEGLYKGRI